MKYKNGEDFLFNNKLAATIHRWLCLIDSPKYRKFHDTLVDLRITNEEKLIELLKSSDWESPF